MSTIITRNSANSGSVPSSLIQGELAINVTDGRLFYGSGSGNIVKEFTVSGSGTTNTGSLLTTASFSDPNLTFTKGNGSTFNVDISSLTVISASHALTASYVNPLNQNVIITGSIYIPNNTHSIYFSGSGAPSRLTWNDTDGTLDLGLKGGNVTLQIGQETVARVVNKTGADLLEADFKIVRVRSVAEGGAQGQRLAVVLAQADSEADSATTLGVVTETITNNQEGFITIFGQVKQINTTGAKSYGGLETWVDGDVLYLSPTHAGYLTKVKPVPPQHLVIIGYVEYAHPNNGKIFVKVDNGWEIGELHDVLDLTTSSSYGDLLVKSGSVWVNSKQLTGSYGLTGSLTATSLTGSLQGTSSYALTASYVLNAPDPFPYTGSALITGSLGITGSLIVLQSLDSQNRYLIDINNVNSVEWSNRFALDSLSTTVIDWDNQQLFQGSSGILSANWSSHTLYDNTALQSIDWTNRLLYDISSSIAVDWTNRLLQDSSNVLSIAWDQRVLSDFNNNNAFIWDTPSQNYALGAYAPILTDFLYIEDFAAFTSSLFGGTIEQNLAGEILRAGSIIDAGVSVGNLVYLNTDGIWYKTNQSSQSSSYMLAICTDAIPGKEKVFIEGTIGFVTSSIANMPYVSGSNFYGTPIYISGSNGAMSTQKPTSGIVRVVGHAFYNSTGTPANWLMKFRPSNDWYEI